MSVPPGPKQHAKRLWRLSHVAQCDDILAKCPEGVNTIYGTKGVYFSGGEIQRLMLARAILKQADIVVLDEATAFADPENEVLIQKAFSELTQNCTVLMIAHRLSTVRNADTIVVLSEGKVVEQGNHDEITFSWWFVRKNVGELRTSSFVEN